MATLKNTTILDTGLLRLPTGTTAQRTAPVNGSMRFNTTTGRVEFYRDDRQLWVNTHISNLSVVATGGTVVYDIVENGIDYRVHVFRSGTNNFVVTQPGEVEYLIVAGGGGGGVCYGGGGGAGGLIAGTTTVAAQTYPIVVGTGGTNRVNTSGNGGAGANSTAFGLTAIGGGFGGGNCGNAGGNGGSGGGGSSSGGSSGAAGTGTSGQGNSGATSPNGSGSEWGGGGGGAGAAASGSLGGRGINLLISGDSLFYAGGGRGSRDGAPQPGGVGGGGSGGIALAVGIADGAPNTGGGGGGSIISGSSGASGIGGSGVVIIRYKINKDLNSPIVDPIVRENLVFNLDPGVGYSGGGTIVEDNTQTSIRGTLVNGVGIARTRSSGSAFVFDGTDDRITVGKLNHTFNEFTVLVWFNARAVENYRNVLDCNFNAFPASGNIGPRLEMNSSGVLGWLISGVETNNDINNVYNVIPSGMTANVWRYVGITRNSAAQVSTYLNGAVVVNQSANSNGFVDVFNNVFIGRGFHLSSDAQRSFRGEIGLVQMYNRALTSTQVEQNYNATRWRYGV